MNDSQAIDPRVSNLTALIESIVEQVLGRKFSDGSTTWMTNESKMNNYYPRLSYETTGGAGNDAGGHVRNALETYRQISQYIDGLPGSNSGKLNGSLSSLSGLGGMFSAYRNGDPMGGALSGAQFGQAFKDLGIGGTDMGPIGAAIGFLAGIFSKGQDYWNRPKFRDAKQAYEKMFTVDRGEDNPYDLPESYYFRTGSSIPGMITVNIGNKQLDDHIRDSLTNSYASQLQRGLVS